MKMSAKVNEEIKWKGRVNPNIRKEILDDMNRYEKRTDL